MIIPVVPVPPPQHAMGIANDMRDHRLMIKYSSKFTPEQFAVFDGHFRPRNEAFARMNLEGKDRTRWHYQRYIKNYLRCVRAVDENIGRLLSYLDENGLADNTIVIYSSDQGFYLGEHGWFDKRWMYEESYRTPLVVRWPGKCKAGSINEGTWFRTWILRRHFSTSRVPRYRRRCREDPLFRF